MKIGDKVIMNDKYRVREQDRNNIFVVRSCPWDCCGTSVVLLEGKPGGYAVVWLKLVKES